MRVDELAELHYIAPIANVASIAMRGILCNRQATSLPHTSVANPAVQEKRDRTTVPGGLPLHDYANLYISARNPMMYSRRDRHEGLCVLRVSTDVLYWEGVVVASANAGSRYTRYSASPDGLATVDVALVYAEYWTDADEVAYYRKKAAKCAEVLVPGRVPPEAVFGAYVSCEAARRALTAQAPNLPIAIDAHTFFWRGG